MAGRRCSLCDGKLNSEGRCTFCGLDNTKSDRYYRLNQSNCDDASLTHVHEDDGSVRYAKRIIGQGSTINGSGKAKTIREADWEINRGQAQKKYQDTYNQSKDARSAASSYSGKKKPVHGLNADDYMERRGLVRKIVIICFTVLILLQIISVLIAQFRYSPALYSIQERVEDLFGSGSEPVWEDDAEVKEGEIYDEFFENRDDWNSYFEENPDFYHDFIEEFGDDFFDEWDLGPDDGIMMYPDGDAPVDGKL